MLVFDADRLIAHQFAEELYLVDPVMPSGGHVLLHGKRGLGKTQLALTLAHDIIGGHPFLGCLTTRRGRVAYIQADMPPKLQQARLQQLNRVMPVDYQGALRYYLVDSQLDIMHITSAPWVADIQAYAPALVIVDTLRKSHRLDENSSDTPVAIYAAWRAAVGPTPTIVYLHHDRKTSFDGPTDRDEEFRGSGAWLDEADLGIHLIRTRAGLVLEWSKSRTFDPETVGGSFALQLDPQTLLLQAVSGVDAYMREAIRRQLPREQIITTLQDTKRWGSQALSRATAFRRLEGYIKEIADNAG